MNAVSVEAPLNQIAELRGALEQILDTRVESLRRTPYAYGSSFALDTLDVGCAGGTTLRLLLKDLGAASELARSVRPATPHYDPLREIAVYDQILVGRGLGTAHCYGAVVDRDRGRYWLFLEHVPGIELWQVGELSLWRAAASWLAALHSTCRDVSHPRLARYDRDFCEQWFRRAQAATPPGQLDAIASALVDVVDRLLALPSTLIHGEFYAPNVLIERRDGGVRVCAIDWETAARGPGLIDLAALTAGEWDEADRAMIAAAYNDALTVPMSEVEFSEALACCRLQVALQWLGWAPQWRPPPEHAPDWMAVALGAAGELGIV